MQRVAHAHVGQHHAGGDDAADHALLERGLALQEAHRHVGIYAYSRAFLERYPHVPPSYLERSECLEQLRFLQAGARIKVLVKPPPATGMRGIDTPEDYRDFVARQKQSS